MRNTTKGKIIKGSALAVDVVAPFVATLSQFPIWIEKGSQATMSGLFLVFAFLSCIPFLTQIKKWLKSPSVPILWLVFFVVFKCLSNIIDQMSFICMVGAVANLGGAGLYIFGNSIENKPDKPIEENNNSETVGG